MLCYRNAFRQGLDAGHIAHLAGWHRNPSTIGNEPAADSTAGKLEMAAMEDFVAYPSRRRLALLALGAVTFVAAGLWMGGAFGSPPDSRRYSEPAMFAIGWFGVVLFGACGLVAGKKLFENGEQLRIGSAGVRWAPGPIKPSPGPRLSM